MLTKSYNAILMITIAVLVILIASLSVLLLKNGPRVRGVDFEKDVTESSLLAGSTATIRFDRPLKESDYSDQIQFTPKVAFTASTSSQAVVLRFNENLRSNTTYIMRISENIYDKTGRQMKTAYEETFRTGIPNYIYLERNYGFVSAEDAVIERDADDYIMKATLGGEAEPIFSHPKITMFATNDEYLSVAVSENDEDRLFTLKFDTDEIREETLAFTGRVDNLVMGPRSKVAMYTIAPDFDDVPVVVYEELAQSVHTLNLETGNTEPLYDMDSERLRAVSLQIDTNGQAVLLQDFNETFYVASPFGDYDPIIVGSYSGSFGFNYLGTELLFRDRDVIALYDVANSETTRLEPNTTDYIQDISNETTKIIATNSFTFGNANSTIQMFDMWSDDGEVLWSNVEYPNTTIRDIAVSYSEEYIAVQQNPFNCTFDGLNPRSQCEFAETLLLDASSGEVLLDFRGFGLVWLP